MIQWRKQGGTPPPKKNIKTSVGKCSTNPYKWLTIKQQFVETKTSGSQDLMGSRQIRFGVYSAYNPLAPDAIRVLTCLSINPIRVCTLLANDATHELNFCCYKLDLDDNFGEPT